MATVTHQKIAVGADHPTAEINKGEWNAAHTVVMAPLDMGIYVGTAEPVLKTYAQWLSSRTGYWAWIDISGEVAEVVTATIMASNADGSVAPLASAFARYATASINPADAVGSIAKLAAQVTVPGQVSAEVKSASATGMVTALTAAYIRYISATMQSGNSTGSINHLVAAYARYMTTVVGVANAAGSINALVATVSGGGSDVTYVSSTARQTGDASVQLTLPAGVQANDILLLHCYQVSTAVPPSGWTDSGGTGADGRVFWRRATGSGDAPTVQGADDGSGYPLTFYARIVAFRNCITSGTPFDPASPVFSNSSLATFSGEALTTGYDGSMIVFFAMASNTVSAIGGSIDTLLADSVAAPYFHIGYDSTPNAAGVQAAPTMTQALAQTVHFVTLALRKA